MDSKIFNFLAETFIHPGAGQNEGAIDLPVAREAATDYPYVPGSGLKGALRDAARGVWPDIDSQPDAKAAGEVDETADTALADRTGSGQLAPEVAMLFGKSDNAGDLLVSDLRLLLLPVRCLTASYRWLTCPHLLERLQRDMRRASRKDAQWEIPEKIQPGQYLGSGEGQLQLEERSFDHGGTPDDLLIGGLAAQVPDARAAGRLGERLAILSDDDFAWFARYGLPVQAHNKLQNVTKKSVALWFEETLPPDTLTYALISARNHAGSLTTLTKLFTGADGPYLQVGGNETVGQGWLRVGWDAGGAGGEGK